MSRLELSHQQVPLTAEHDATLALSLPLFDMQGDAPPIPIGFEMDDVHYSISNDESARAFDQLRARINTPEYQGATNRVAILIGESSLMTELPNIPEDTIILLDKSPDMTAFMAKYVAGLQAFDKPGKWMHFMGIVGDFDSFSEGYKDLAYRLMRQSDELEDTGYMHVLNDYNAYSTSHELANRKAIIPWTGDITNPEDMAKLGAALKKRNANVTLLNLTNVLIAANGLDTAADCADVLDLLPVTPNAPILATSWEEKEPADGFAHGYTVEQTGPFFGLDNLRQHGGSLSDGDKPGSVILRQYVPGFKTNKLLNDILFTALHEVTPDDQRNDRSTLFGIAPSIGVVASNGLVIRSIDIGPEATEPGSYGHWSYFEDETGQS